MKRHSALQDLSREHHPALVLAMACKRAASSGNADLMKETCLRAAHEYDSHMAQHFLHEEHSLLPLLLNAGETALVERTLEQHKTLRAQVESLRQHDTAVLETFGQALSGHVRFEEQQLFPAAEQAVPLDLLETALSGNAGPGASPTGK